MSYVEFEVPENLVERTYQVGHAVTYDKEIHSQVIGLGFTYEYIFFMTQRTNFYALIHLADLAYVTEYDYKDDNNEISQDFLPVPRVSPGVGFEYKS